MAAQSKRAKRKAAEALSVKQKMEAAREELRGKVINVRQRSMLEQLEKPISGRVGLPDPPPARKRARRKGAEALR